MNHYDSCPFKMDTFNFLFLFRKIFTFKGKRLFVSVDFRYILPLFLFICNPKSAFYHSKLCDRGGFFFTSCRNSRSDSPFIVSGIFIRIERNT